MLACVVDLIFVAGDGFNICGRGRGLPAFNICGWGRALPAGQDTLDHLGTSG